MSGTTRPSPLAMYDLTIPCDRYTLDDVKDFMRTYCKRWAFQQESGEETGYIHYQCRISLISKKRIDNMVPWIHNKFLGFRCSPTSSPTFYSGNEFYVIKPDTRIAGPWNDRDDINMTTIPRRLKVENVIWRPWQTYVREAIALEPDDRTCNVIINAPGNIGKTFLCMWLMARKLATRVPPQKEAKDIMRMILDIPTRTCYFFDLPRATSNQSLNAIYSAIEEIKNGYAYDDRYKFREKIFEPPHVWVFTNILPPSNLLSNDRWKYWTVTPQYELVPMVVSPPIEPLPSTHLSLNVVRNLTVNNY